MSHEATATITISDAGEGTVVTPDKGPSIPWIAIGIAVLILISGAILWRARRRNKVRILDPSSADR